MSSFTSNRKLPIIHKLTQVSASVRIYIYVSPASFPVYFVKKIGEREGIRGSPQKKKNDFFFFFFFFLTQRRTQNIMW